MLRACASGARPAAAEAGPQRHLAARARSHKQTARSTRAAARCGCCTASEPLLLRLRGAWAKRATARAYAAVAAPALSTRAAASVPRGPSRMPTEGVVGIGGRGCVSKWERGRVRVVWGIHLCWGGCRRSHSLLQTQGGTHRRPVGSNSAVAVVREACWLA